MTRTAISILLAITGAVDAFAAPALAGVGYGKAARFTLTPRHFADLALSGNASHLEMELTLEPGRPVAEWRAADQAAREKGERLPEKLTLATLVVEYEDGRTVETSLRYNESVGPVTRDWWNPVDGFIYHLAFAEVAWTRPLNEGGLQYACVYRMTWFNPRPAVGIGRVTVEAEDGLEGGKLLVFSAELRDQPATPGRMTYFVAPTGDDAGPGTYAQPWATLGKAAVTIRAGDTVYVRGGLYKPTERILFKYLDAPEGQRTSVIGWPGETATFDFMEAHWDMRRTRKEYGFEPYPHDVSMIEAYDCDRFTIKNLHLIHSRARGFGMETGWLSFYDKGNLDNGGRPEQINNEPFVDSEISYCSVWRVYSAGIRFALARNSRLIGNELVRAQSISMGPGDPKDLGAGPVAGLEATTFFDRDGHKQRNPPMECIDSGRLFGCVTAYNEICWGDKECMLIDGNTDHLRIHHNYVHDAWNLPWCGGIAPNGYGKQQYIEIDHNIAAHVGSGFGVGTEGGGLGQYVRIHHNLAMDCHWNAFDVTGAWGDGSADLKHISIYNNTAWHNGCYTNNPRIQWKENTGPAGGIAVSFARGYGKKGKDIAGVVEDVTVADNLILQPRDYAQALVNDGDPVAAGIVFTHNLTDLPKDDAKLNELQGWKKNQRWRGVRDDKLIVVDQPVLQDPKKRDFRPLPGTPAADGGVALGEDGKPAHGSSTVGAFAPGARWIEVGSD